MIAFMALANQLKMIIEIAMTKHQVFLDYK